MANTIESGMAFDVDDCRRVIQEAWSRFTGMPATTSASGNWRAPGLFGLIQRRRWHLFKLQQADPVLPTEMGEYPRFQSDTLRQKHLELVSRLMENKFTIQATAAGQTGTGEKQRALADRAEWLLTYGAQQIQQRTGIDWQKALAEGASAYCYGTLKCIVAPELIAKTPDARYADDLPADEPQRYRATSESADGDVSKGKYRETPDSVKQRAQRAKALAPFPFHVEVVAPDQVAFIEDESYRAGPAMAVHIRDVGIVDYNGKLAKDGLNLAASPGDGQSIRLSLQEMNDKIDVAIERPAPSGTQLPSVAGWKQRISVAEVWTRDEYYELASASLLTGASDSITNQTAWLLVKAAPHGYGRVPFYRAYATVEQQEWDPALRYRPALDGLYAAKPFYDYSRALEVRIATEIAIKRYFMTQDVNAPPVMEGDEEGDQVILTRDSTQAQVLPPGMKIDSVGPDDMSPAFVRSRELQGAEMLASAPQTGTSEIAATTQPWTARLGQAQANTYPIMVLQSITNALQEMFKNMVEVAAKPVEDGGLGVGLYVPGHGDDSAKDRVDMAKVIGMEPEDWDGIAIDVLIDPTSGAERVTQVQLDLQLLNNTNGKEVMTPEYFVTHAMGIQNATAHMQEVEAWKAAQPFIGPLVQQELTKMYGSRVTVGADGSMTGASGQPMQPADVLAQAGVRPATPPPGSNGAGPGSVPGMSGTARMPDLPGLDVNGAAPIPGMTG